MRKLAMAALAGILVITGCSGPASVNAARQNVDIFHNHFNSGNFQAIWDNSAPDITEAGPKEAFMQLLGNLRGFYGKAMATEQTGWRFNENTGGSFSSVVMKTTFEKGIAYEDFIFRNYGDQQKLAGYHISKDPPKSSSSASASPSASASQ